MTLTLKDIILSANTGLDAIKRAPIVDYKTGIKCLRIQDISQKKRVDYWGFTEVEKRNFEKFQLRKNDIIVARTGATVGINMFINKDLSAVFNNGLIRLRINNENHPKFIYYILQNKKFQTFINNISGGTSTQPNIRIDDLLRFEIPETHFKEQKRIAGILTSLDDKIELNNQMNQRLEEMAKLLYKQWFVDFEFPNENGKPYKSSGGEMVESELGLIPKGWEVRELGNLQNYGVLVMGNSPKSETYNENKVGLPLINGASDYNELEIKAKKYTSAPSRVCTKGDYIFGVRATIGNIKISDDKYAIGRGVGALTNIPDDKKVYMYFVLKNAFKQLELSASGSVYASISKPDLLNLKVLKMQKSVIDQFSKVSNTLFEKKELILNEQKELSEVKNRILDKLI